MSQINRGPRWRGKGAETVVSPSEGMHFYRKWGNGPRRMWEAEKVPHAEITGCREIRIK